MPAEQERLAHIDKMVNLLDEDRPVYPPPLMVLRSFLTEVQWLKAELLAAQEQLRIRERNGSAESRLRENIRLERELQAAQEREKVWKDAHVSAVAKYKNAEEREKALREAARSVQIGLGQTAYEGTTVSVSSAKRYERILADALAGTAGSPSEKPDSEQKQKTLSTSDYTTTMATGAGVREDPSEKPGSALLESAQGLSDPGMADVPSEKPGSEEYDEGKYGDWRDNPGNYGE